jgi:WD40 repeat protein
MSGDRIAVAGGDSKIRIYNELDTHKQLEMTLRANGKLFPGHSNRIFALKFDKNDDNILYSAGWDDTV